jgi:DNA topoisomerase-1
VVEVLKQKKAIKAHTKIYRISFNEITKTAVRHAVANPRELDMDLINAQQARRALDYLVGFTLSPVLWRKLPGSRSAGRVQSVALRLICEREGEIEQFIPREFWDIKLDMLTQKQEAFSARLTHVNGKKLEQFDLHEEKPTHAIAKELENKQYSITQIDTKQSRRNPQPPFTTSSMQQEASRKLGFGAKRTMMAAQKLYEGVDIGGETVGLITYMRTDGVTVAQEAILATRKLIESEYGKQYVPEKQRFYTAKAKNAQEAHEAIRPTDVSRTPSQVARYVDKEQLALYTLVWKRMIASQMESAVLDQTAVTIESSDRYATLRANGSIVRFDGFYTLYRESHDDSDEDENNSLLPVMDKGESTTLSAVHPAQHFTQPPPRYTEASLVKRMEELGIGRPSTYASIISVLQERDYVRIDKKRFVAENRGRVVTAFLESFFKRYVEYDFTAQLEEALDDVSDGKLNWKDLLRDFWKDFNTTVQQAKEKDIPEILSAMEILLEHHIFTRNEKGDVDRNCPSCNTGTLSLKNSRYGAFLGCSHYPDCRYTRQLSESSGEEDGDKPLVLDANNSISLGTHPKTGQDITLRKGPYGFYVQLGEPEGKDKPKRASIPKSLPAKDVTLESALSLLALPREVGLHPETQKPIIANIGRFGPYLQHDSKFTSLKGDDDVLTIGINRAVTVIAESANRASAEPLKDLGKHPETGKEVKVYEGRYGPYVKHEKINASLPKSVSVEEITLEQAVSLLATQAAKKGTGKKKASTKKVATKKEPKKKPAAKKKAKAKPKKASKKSA